MTKTKQNLKSLLKSTGRTLHVDEDILKTAPTGTGTITFFKLGKYISDDDLEKEYASRGLLPATIESMVKYDLSNQKDMDEKQYVATHWKDAGGQWCYSTFYRWNDEREVNVNRRYDNDWRDYWWFAGVRSSTKLSESKPLNSDAQNLALAIEQVKKAGYQVSKIM